MSTDSKTIKKESATQRFHREVLELRAKMPKDWKIRYFKKFPEYDNYSGAVLVGNVFYLRTTDSTVLENFKSIVLDFQNEQNG
jgi:hypothetical protein